MKVRKQTQRNNEHQETKKSEGSAMFTDLQTKAQKGQDRLAVNDLQIEKLQTDRKTVLDMVFSIKQRQFDLLQSAIPHRDENLSKAANEDQPPPASTQ